MKKILWCLVAFCATCATWAATVNPYSGSRIFWDETTRKVVFNGGGYARVTKLQDGRLMAVCESGGIRISFSSDMGTTWTESQLIAPNPTKVSECVPDLIQLSDGTIIVAYNPRPHEPYSTERKFGIRCRRSTDKGKTWSSEIFVNDASHVYTDGCWEPSMLELPSGELQLYFADEGPYTNSGEQQISLCRSFDKGKTWSKPENISFRAGFRDGMPVPILLQDQSEIVVIIEDNGCGYGNFYPVTVRTTLDNNWKDGYVNATSSRRAIAVDRSMEPVWLGGAPYLRQMPNGETIFSHQSDHRKGNEWKMVVGVGDAKARNFKALTHPFAHVDGQNIMWNSVSPIDDGIVMAVGGVAGKVEVVKGYLMQQFECPYETPKMDGKFTATDHYYGRKTPQIHMGNDLGFACQCDFAHDDDTLYFVARIYDKTIVTSGNNVDGVRLSIDGQGKTTNLATTSAYQYLLTLDGKVSRLYGQGTTFKVKSGSHTRLIAKRSTGYYTLEAAIPWTDMNLTGVPLSKMPRVNIEIIDASTSGTVVTEMMTDARNTEPWTWMPLNLQGVITDIDDTQDANAPLSIHALNGQLQVVSTQPIAQINIYSLDGKLLSSHDSCGTRLCTTLPKGDILIVRLTMADGQVIKRKISIAS